MISETIAVASPKMDVALAGVPVKGHTWSSDLEKKKNEVLNLPFTFTVSQY